ncbi:MAG: hypothetical protein OXB86_04850 [Bdellovibrionales bacterium]|nr:hypothetical protein [Bdellovibrionales bacterium]
MFRLLLLSVILFSFPALSEEQKLVILPASIESIPKEVKDAARAVGNIASKTGFFIDQGVFVSSMHIGMNPSAVYDVSQFGETTAEEAKVSSHLLEGELATVHSGKATLIKGIGYWGVFKVDYDGGKRLFSRKPTQFLQVSDFHKGDRVFLLSTYLHNRTIRPGIQTQENLIMEVANSSDIQDIAANVDLEASPLLGASALREKLHHSIAVNQKGEVIAFLDLQNGVNRLIKFDSELKALFSEATQIILTDNQVNEPSLSEVDEEVQSDNLITENTIDTEENTLKNKRGFFGCIVSLFKRNK